MMTCCQCQGIEMAFNQKVAARDLKRYRKKGPRAMTRLLLEALKAQGVEGLTLLDIGGGVGVIQHELLQDGVVNVTSVDASPAYLEAAKDEARRQGHADRVSYHHGDFVDVAPDIPPADIVTLEWVICCYHDMQALVDLSSARARKLYAVVIDRAGLGKIGTLIINFYFWLRRSPFRNYYHPPEAVDAIVRSNGLEPLIRHKTFYGQVVVYAPNART